MLSTVYLGVWHEIDFNVGEEGASMCRCVDASMCAENEYQEETTSSSSSFVWAALVPVVAIVL